MFDGSFSNRVPDQLKGFNDETQNVLAKDIVNDGMKSKDEHPNPIELAPILIGALASMLTIQKSDSQDRAIESMKNDVVNGLSQYSNTACIDMKEQVEYAYKIATCETNRTETAQSILEEIRLNVASIFKFISTNGSEGKIVTPVDFSKKNKKISRGKLAEALQNKDYKTHREKREREENIRLALASAQSDGDSNTTSSQEKEKERLIDEMQIEVLKELHQHYTFKKKGATEINIDEKLASIDKRIKEAFQKGVAELATSKESADLRTFSGIFSPDNKKSHQQLLAAVDRNEKKGFIYGIIKLCKELSSTGPRSSNALLYYQCVRKILALETLLDNTEISNDDNINTAISTNLDRLKDEKESILKKIEEEAKNSDGSFKQTERKINALTDPTPYDLKNLYQYKHLLSSLKPKNNLLRAMNITESQIENQSMQLKNSMEPRFFSHSDRHHEPSSIEQKKKAFYSALTKKSGAPGSDPISLSEEIAFTNKLRKSLTKKSKNNNTIVASYAKSLTKIMSIEDQITEKVLIIWLKKIKEEPNVIAALKQHFDLLYLKKGKIHPWPSSLETLVTLESDVSSDEERMVFEEIQRDIDLAIDLHKNEEKTGQFSSYNINEAIAVFNAMHEQLGGNEKTQIASRISQLLIQPISIADPDIIRNRHLKKKPFDIYNLTEKDAKTYITDYCQTQSGSLPDKKKINTLDSMALKQILDIFLKQPLFANEFREKAWPYFLVKPTEHEQLDDRSFMKLYQYNTALITALTLRIAKKTAPPKTVDNTQNLDARIKENDSMLEELAESLPDINQGPNGKPAQYKRLLDLLNFDDNDLDLEFSDIYDLNEDNDEEDNDEEDTPFYGFFSKLPKPLLMPYQNKLLDLYCKPGSEKGLIENNIETLLEKCSPDFSCLYEFRIAPEKQEIKSTSIAADYKKKLQIKKLFNRLYSYDVQWKRGADTALKSTFIGQVMKLDALLSGEGMEHLKSQYVTYLLDHLKNIPPQKLDASKDLNTTTRILHELLLNSSNDKIKKFLDLSNDKQNAIKEHIDTHALTFMLEQATIDLTKIDTIQREISSLEHIPKSNEFRNNLISLLSKPEVLLTSLSGQESPNNKQMVASLSNFFYVKPTSTNHHNENEFEKIVAKVYELDSSIVDKAVCEYLYNQLSDILFSYPPFDDASKESAAFLQAINDFKNDPSKKNKSDALKSAEAAIVTVSLWSRKKGADTDNYKKFQYTLNLLADIKNCTSIKEFTILDQNHVPKGNFIDQKLKQCNDLINQTISGYQDFSTKMDATPPPQSPII